MLSVLAGSPFPGSTGLTSGSRMPLTLVVDDEPAVRGLISAILREEGFQTLEAGDGTQALQIVMALDGEVDLIVSDIQMPNGDGLSLARAVGVSHPEVPIILISGHVKPDAGFEFVQKPFSENVLLKAVRSMLGCKSRTACSD